MKRRSQTIPTHVQWCLSWAHRLLPSSSEFKGQSNFLLRSVTFSGPMSRRCPDSVCVTVKSNVVVNLKHCWAAAMFVVFESDKRVHCSLLHCVCAHVRVYGWLHSLHSTVIDMSVRHCPANEMTSLIDRALTRLSTGPNMVNMRLTSHMPNLSQQFKPSKSDHSGQKKGRTLKKRKHYITSKKPPLIIYCRSVWSYCYTKTWITKIVKLKRSKTQNTFWNAFWMSYLVTQSQSCTVLHLLSKNLISSAKKKSEQFSDHSSQSASQGPV